MLIKKREYATGYNLVTSVDDKNDIAKMDFGIIRLEAGDIYRNAEKKERAILLIYGAAEIAFGGVRESVKRDSFLDENPVCVHLPEGEEVTITASCTTEFAYEAVYNANSFDPKLYTQQECVTENLGKDEFGDTANRFVRTVIDDSIAPHSNLVLGEVINRPGKWSSYPPHFHVQPEIYHYRLFPEQGFGFSCEGEDVYKVYSGDTVVISSGVVHPQVAAPGYAMYYLWMIPHAPKRWMKDREYAKQHEWLLSNPVIWPER